jgi:hypothetical protein
MAPSAKKRGSAETKNRSRKEKSRAPRKFKNVVQPEVEQCHSNADDP